MTARSIQRWTPAAIACAALLAPSALAKGSGDVVIRLCPGTSIEDICARYEVTVVSEISSRGIFRVRAGEDTPYELMAWLMGGDSGIVAAETDDVAEVVSGHTQSFFFRLNAEYTQQPALALLAANPAGPDGAGVTVAVLDTGISPNSSISAAILPGFNFVDNSEVTAEFGPGIDSNGNGIIDEMSGHGTFIAGLVSLVAPHCNLLPVKVLDSDGQGTVYTVAAGIYYATDQGARVINLSLSFDRESTVVSDALQYARDHGVIVVASVGNDNTNAPVFPAAGPGVIAVAATTLLDHKASFSDYGSFVDLCAPGENVISTLPNDMLGVGSGASFATAWVSGTAALIQGSMIDPTPDRVSARLTRSAMKVPATLTEFPGLMGKGRLSIGNAFASFSKASAKVAK